MSSLFLLGSHNHAVDQKAFRDFGAPMELGSTGAKPAPRPAKQEGNLAPASLQPKRTAAENFQSPTAEAELLKESLGWFVLIKRSQKFY